MPRLRLIIAIGCAALAGCTSSGNIDQPLVDSDGSTMIEFIRVTRQTNGLTFAEFRFTNKTGRKFDYFGDRKNAPRTIVEQETPEGWQPCGAGLCGNTGAKPDFFSLAPGASITFSVRWDVYSKHPVKRLGIQIFPDQTDRKRNEIIWGGTLREPS